MAKEIAVHTLGTGETAAITQPGKITIYIRRNGKWNVERELDFCLEQEKGLRAMRHQMAGVIDYLGACKVFVAGSITGVPYYELQKAGLSVWEFAGKPEQFLDHVLETEETEQRKKTVPVAVPKLKSLGNGLYRISIKEIQENDTGITTKQVLAPVLRQGNYYQIEVLCNHVPPWLEAEAMAGSIQYATEKISAGEVRVTIQKPVCSEQ